MNNLFFILSTSINGTWNPTTNTMAFKTLEDWRIWCDKMGKVDVHDTLGVNTVIILQANFCGTYNEKHKAFEDLRLFEKLKRNSGRN